MNIYFTKIILQGRYACDRIKSLFITENTVLVKDAIFFPPMFTVTPNAACKL